MGQKAIVYARVSTTRQADHDLSIPDQIAHAELIRLIAYKERELNQPVSKVMSHRVEVVSRALRAALKGDSNPQLRRAYIRHFLTEVSVSEKCIRISGPKASLAQQLTAEKRLPPSMVPSTVQEWRAREDEGANWVLIVPSCLLKAYWLTS